MKVSKADKAQAWAFLEHYRGASIRSEYLNTSRAGTSRIRFLAAAIDERTGKAEIQDITWAISRITEYRFNRDYGCIVASFMNMRQDYAIMTNFNYSAASHDLEAKGLEVSWNTPEGKKALGLNPDARIYDDYFFNANRM
jgi:hypothetical protein